MRHSIWASFVYLMRPGASRSNVVGSGSFGRTCCFSRQWGSGSLLWFAAVVAAGAGCHVHPENCQFQCDDGRCTDGMVCNAENYCVGPDWIGTCKSATGGAAGHAGSSGQSSAAGTNAISTGRTSEVATGGTTAYGGSAGAAGAETETGAAGAGGNGGVPTAPDGAAVTAGTGSVGGVGGRGGIAGAAACSGTGVVGGAGAAGAPNGGMGGVGGQLTISLVPPSPWCVGTYYDGVLTASGGGPSFTWTVNRLVSGLVFGNSTTANNPLTGTPKEAGAPEIAVADGLHTPGTLTLIVNAPPTITTKDLPTACLGEVYRVQLTAEGVLPANLEWSGTELADWGLTLSASGLVSGVIKKTGDLTLNVSARDKTTTCKSDTVKLETKVYGETHLACPSIRVREPATGDIALSAMPAPASCRGWPYSSKFAVTGGSSNYSWSIVEPPSGFDFNPLTQTLTSAQPTVGVTVTLQVTDSTTKGDFQRTLTIPIREKCWLGYVSDETGPNRLHLFDPLLLARGRRPTSDSTDLSVLDFKFSPNGKFVAYRFRKGDGTFSLSLWQAPEWNRDLDFSLEGSVVSYEWSSDSRVLAIASTTTSGTLLGGVNVELVPDSSSPGTIQRVTPLVPISTPLDAASPLVWYGSDKYVGSHVLDRIAGGTHRNVLYAPYTQTGFSSYVTPDVLPYDASPPIYPSATGFHVTDSSRTVLRFYPIGSSISVKHGNDALSPSGAYVASARSGQLQLFRAEDPSYDTSSPAWRTAAGCDTLLTWARSLERVACIDATNTTVRTHTLSADGSTISSESLASSSAYVQGTWSASRRLFSPSGRWLALATDDRLHLGAIDSGNSAVTWSTELTADQTTADLGFSPDERLLAWQDGPNLFVYEIGGPGNLSALIDILGADAASCREEWLSWPEWCGSDRGAKQFVWSPNSDLIAFVNLDGILRVENLRIRPISVIEGGVNANARCEGACSGGFRFQP